MTVAGRRPAPRWRRKAVLLAACGVAAAAWHWRATLLEGAANAWIDADVPSARADAVLVLGGGLETRPYAAAGYYRSGMTGKVLVTHIRPARSERLGIVSSQSELTRRVLLATGVPERDIEEIGRDNHNTHDEALALRAWLERTHARSVIVPTELFSSRRTKWILETVLRGAGATVQVVALEPEEYGRGDWWRHDPGLIAFNNEVLKYFYYRFAY